MAFTFAGQYTEVILGTSSAGFAVALPALSVHVYTVGTTTHPTLYTSRTKGTTTANPTTTDANGNLTFYVDPGQYDIVFTPPGGSQKRITVTVPADPAESSAAYVTHAGPSNGTDDTATIQALLDAARVAGGGVVRGMPGAAYKTTAPLVIGTGTTLGMRGCSVTLTGNKNILQSYALNNPQRTVTDGAITASSTTLTSATAAFTSADVGRSVTVAGAGPSGIVHSARIASVTNGTTVVLDATAKTTVSGASTKLYDRDSKIKVRGGRWVSPNDGTGGGQSVHHMVLCRVDDLVVDLDGFSAPSTTSKYAVYLPDVTNFDVSVRGLNSGSDGVHVQGPASDGVIRHVEGTSQDDFVVLGAGDTGATENFTSGDITDVEILDVRPNNLVTNSVKLYGLTGQFVRRVHVESVRGTSGVKGISLGASDMVGGYLDQISLGNIEVDDSYIVAIAANGSSLTARRLSTRYALANPIQAVYLTAGFSWDVVDVSAISLPNASSNGAGSEMIQVYGSIGDLYVREARWSAPSTSPVLSLRNAGASITRAYLSKISSTGGSGFVKAAVSGQVLGTVWLTDCYQTGASFVADLNTTTTLYLSNVVSASATSGSLNLGSVANVTVFGNGARGISLNLATTAGYALRINCPDFSCDAGKITGPINGDKCQNTTASGTNASGSVVFDGVRWRNTLGYRTAATAVLVAGTVTVADTSISGTSRIRLSTDTPGGTVGHPYISARTPGTSFTITSTSGTDTSTIYYEVVTY